MCSLLYLFSLGHPGETVAGAVSILDMVELLEDWETVIWMNPTPSPLYLLLILPPHPNTFLLLSDNPFIAVGLTSLGLLYIQSVIHLKAM